MNLAVLIEELFARTIGLAAQARNSLRMKSFVRGYGVISMGVRTRMILEVFVTENSVGFMRFCGSVKFK